MSDTGALEAHRRRGARRQPEVGRGVPRRQGQGLQRAGRPGHEGQPRARPTRPQVNELLKKKLGLTPAELGAAAVRGGAPAAARVADAAAGGTGAQPIEPGCAPPQSLLQALELGVVERVDAHHLGLLVLHQRTLRVGGRVVGVELLLQLGRHWLADCRTRLSSISGLRSLPQQLRAAPRRRARLAHVVERRLARLLVRRLVRESATSRLRSRRTRRPARRRALRRCLALARFAARRARRRSACGATTPLHRAVGVEHALLAGVMHSGIGRSEVSFLPLASMQV